LIVEKEKTKQKKNGLCQKETLAKARISRCYNMNRNSKKCTWCMKKSPEKYLLCREMFDKPDFVHCQDPEKF